MKNIIEVGKKLWAIGMVGVVVGMGILGVTGNMYAANNTVTLAAGGKTNLVPVSPSGQSVISSWLLTAPAGANATVAVYDSPTNNFTYTNASYSILYTYVTNAITLYTNYWGATNSFTNAALVSVTNTVAASTNNYTAKFVAGAPTNASALYNQGTYTFNNGVWATNTGPSTITITVTYEQ